MLLAVLGDRFIKLSKQILLLLRQINRRFHKHMDVKISHVACAQALDTLAAQAQNEARLRRLRRQRENECFSVINRGYLWYAQLSEEQLSQLGAWYRAWLDVTETQIVPQKHSCH